MNLALLCGGYPPEFDAIGQYTRALAFALKAEGAAISVLTGHGTSAPHEEAFPVEPIFDPRSPATLAALPDAIARIGAEWLIVQYNPFSYGPRGRAPALIDALETIQRRGKTRLAVMLHETRVPPFPSRSAYMRLWQTPQLHRLCRLADRLFLSTQRWRNELPSGCVPPLFLPVGSNLPLCPLDRDQARARLGIAPGQWIAGMFGNHHPSRLPEWVGKAVKQLPGEPLLLYVGRDGPAFQHAIPDVPLRDEGALDDADAALRLRAMDALLSPFTDGVSARRGSVLAALRQGVPVATTARHWSDTLLLENPLVFASPCADGVEGFTQQVQRLRALTPEGWPRFDFDASPFAWPVMARTLLHAL